MKRHTCNIAGVTLKGHERIWVGTADVIELYILIACCCKPALIRGDAEAVDLRVGMLDYPGTDTRERFPEADCVVVACCGS